MVGTFTAVVLPDADAKYDSDGKMMMIDDDDDCVDSVCFYFGKQEES